MPERPGRRQEYWARINRALDFIDTHLGEDLTLEEIARSAHFSPFHFHRVFSSLMGEPVSQFVQRLRLERAATLLRAHPGRPVTRIAMECGYGSHASFSRAFRGAFGQSPSQWRERCESLGTEVSKDGIALSKNGKAEGNRPYYPADATEERMHLNQGREAMDAKLKMEMRVEDLPETTVAYIRHVGPYAGDSELFQGLFGRLFQWAGPRNLLRFPETQILSIYHDDPHVTDEEKLRVSVGITVPSATQVSGEVGKLTLPGGRYAQARFELGPQEYEAAWNKVYGEWLPDSGYLPGDGLAFERYLNDPGEHPEGKHIVEICLPVIPL